MCETSLGHVSVDCSSSHPPPVGFGEVLDEIVARAANTWSEQFANAVRDHWIVDSSCYTVGTSMSGACVWKVPGGAV